MQLLLLYKLGQLNLIICCGYQSIWSWFVKMGHAPMLSMSSWQFNWCINSWSEPRCRHPHVHNHHIIPWHYSYFSEQQLWLYSGQSLKQNTPLAWTVEVEQWCAFIYLLESWAQSCQYNLQLPKENVQQGQFLVIKPGTISQYGIHITKCQTGRFQSGTILKLVIGQHRWCNLSQHSRNTQRNCSIPNDKEIVLE